MSRGLLLLERVLHSSVAFRQNIPRVMSHGSRFCQGSYYLNWDCKDLHVGVRRI